MRTPQIIKHAALQLTLPCAPRPPFLQTPSSDIYPNASILSFHEKTRLARVAEAEARAKKAASDRARRDAARLTDGVTSASGGGGGGVSTKDTLLNGGK